MENRRKHVRVPIRAQVVCVANTQTFRGVTWNVSESRIQVELLELKTRAKLQLTFRLPVSQAIIDVLGSVVWHSDRRHGIKFKYLGEQSRESLRNFIEDRQTGSR
jgi:PilZ domain